MRLVLPVLICLGITVICVQAKRQCRNRGTTSTAPATSNFRSFLAVLPATTAKPAAAKPKVVAKAAVKPKVVAKAKPKVVAKAKPKVVAKAKGPACPKSTPPWHLTYEFGKARCVGLRNIPKSTKHPYDLSNVCRAKDKRAKPMSFHNGAQLTWCKKTVPACQGAVTGMYVKPGKPFEKQWLRNHDGEPTDIPWVVGHPNANIISFQIVAPIIYSVDFKNYTGHGHANVVCAFWL